MKINCYFGGTHNLLFISRLPQAGDDSRGASGFWVEKGRIAYPVHEITIAGNMKDMLKGIEAVGADTYNYGAKTVGSVLINRMKVAGS